MGDGFALVDGRHLRRSVRRHDGPARRRAAPPARSAAPTCATISRSRSRRPFTARPPRSSMPTSVTCEACAGSGAQGRLEAARPARPARGHGRVRAQQGFFAIERTCPTCQGRGQTIDNPCDRCAGAGRVTRERTLSVNVPAGVEDGTRIRLDRRGRGGPARRPGRAISTFSCRSSRIRSSSATAPTSICRVPISMVQAALGGEFTCARSTAATPRCSVPEGAQSGAQLRLRGKGMPVLRSRDFGDLYIQVDRRDAAEPDAAPARAACRSSTPNRRTRPIRKAPASSPR